MPDATNILELDARTVERIAAGEVVERPASVVKELVENAIDADASRIDVEVDAGGTAGIRVSDDGVGMTEAGVRQAVEEHTTSKIGDIDDLEAGVGTLGFRGEALHAIGAVSRMTVTTCPRDASGEAAQASELRVEGGDVVEVGPAGRPPGTTVAVQDLFYNVPARRKYLKTEATEFGHINRIVGGYALANPDVALSLAHDGAETFRTSGGDRREAVLAVYGHEVARNMIAITGGDEPEGPLADISGLVSHPETNRASRDYCTTLVNGRYVQSGAVRDAIVSAYGTQLAADRYPFAVLDLQIDPATIDVNVHPRKLEIRFADEAAVCEQVRAAVEATLLDEGLVRTRAPRGRSASAETEPRPAPKSGGGTASGDADHAEGETDAADAPGSAADAASPGVINGGTAAEPDSAGSTADSGGDSNRGDTSPGDPHERRTTTGADSDGLPHQAALGDQPAPAAVTHEFDALPTVRLIGQFRETYLVGETVEGLVLIDQHAADERINFERLRASVTEDVTTQALADPIEVDVTPGEAAVAEAQQAALASLGFRTESADGTLRVRTVPDLGGGPADPALVRDVLGEILRDAGDPAETVDAAAEALLADLACYPSITGSTALTDGDAIGLLERLDDCENPWACPHGRPTVVLLETDEIEGRFERDYPGH